MKILFVDADAKTLSALQESLVHLSDQWDMSFAAEAAEAREILGAGDLDVVVADMGHGGMGGADLLRIASRRHPEVVRIVGVEEEDLGTAMRTIPEAQQYLRKPYQAMMVEDRVIRAAGLHELLRNTPVRKAVGRIQKLPSVPKIYDELTHALGDLNANAGDVGEVLSHDPALCARVLQLVNSSFFSRGEMCTDITQAVLRLGFQVIKGLVLTVEVFRAPRGGLKVPDFSIQRLQKNAMASGGLVRTMFDDKTQAEEAFLAAVLHDIGQLVMVLELPDVMSEALTRAKAEKRPLHEVEQELMGTSHAEIGAYQLGAWGLPTSIVEAVANHHEPQRVTRRLGFGPMDAVHVAACLTDGLEPNVEHLEKLGVLSRLETWRTQAQSGALAAEELDEEDAAADGEPSDGPQSTPGS